MRFDTSQQMQLGQQMKLAPRMIQSMEILQMPLAALEERIEQELASNPTLELREIRADREQVKAELEQATRDDREGERALNVDDSSANNVDDFERLSNMSEELGDDWSSNAVESADYRSTQDYTPIRRAASGERDAKMDAMANTAARAPSLTDQLLEQWMMVDLPDDVRKAGELLITYIDADGYLRTSMQEIIEQTESPYSLELFEEALDEIQQNLEPTGIGSRDLRECLLLQIEARRDQEDDPNLLSTERLLVSQYLKDIEVNRLPRIAKETNLDIDAIKDGIMSLRQFHPHPGRLLVDEVPHTITPDAIVEFDDEQDAYTVRLSHERVPSLTVSRSYEEMGKDKQTERNTREFINNNLRSARWLIDAISQRNNTLLRVIRAVLEHQRDFFDFGPHALKPLPMTQVADELGIHVATVSRAVADKHIQSPRGIFPLRHFFTSGIETESGVSVSQASILAKLQQIIDDEDKAKPLNDDELVAALKTKGIDIARRTVAKYRGELNIPTARQRKEY